MAFEPFSPAFWWPVLDHLVHLGIALVLTLPLGWDREQSRDDVPTE